MAEPEGVRPAVAGRPGAILPEQNTSEARSFFRGEVAPSGFRICALRLSLD
jgi:hypothetical protein